MTPKVNSNPISDSCTITDSVLDLKQMRIIVYGLPAPQGSKRHVGHGVMIESSKNVAPWREAVKWAARQAIEDGGVPLTGPVSAEMTFTMPRPKSAKSWAQADKRPDLSKLVRCAEDSLTDAGAWEDDARVVICTARKVYPGSHPDALSSPGVVIVIKSSVVLSDTGEVISCKPLKIKKPKAA